MRTRALVAAAALLALPLLASCGDDDEEATSSDTTEQASEAPAEDESEAGHDLSDEDLAAAVEAAQLEPEDLGPGWELTATKGPDEEEDDEPSPIDDCLSDDLPDRFDDAAVAESEKRTFTNAEGVIPSEVESSSVGLDDPELFDEMHALLRDPDFGTCFGEGLQEMVTQDGTEITVGEVEQAEQVVDPGEDPELESTGLSIPLTITAEGTTFETRATMVFLSTGHLGSSMFVFGEDGAVTEEQVAEWGRFLAERLVGG